MFFTQQQKHQIQHSKHGLQVPEQLSCKACQGIVVKQRVVVRPLVSTFLMLVLGAAAVVDGRRGDATPRNCRGGPKHVTLSVGTDPSTEMIVSFASTLSSSSNKNHHDIPVGGILVSTDENDLLQLDDSTSSSNLVLYIETEIPTYYNLSASATKYANDGNGGKLMYYSPYYHHITLSNLQPLTKFYYRIVLHTHMSSFQKLYPNATILTNNTNYYDNKMSRQHDNDETKRIEKHHQQQEEEAQAKKQEVMDAYDKQRMNNPIFTIAGQLQQQPDHGSGLTSLHTARSSATSSTTSATNNDDEILNDDTTGSNDDNNNNDRRKLTQSPPYNGTSVKCPDPRKVRSFVTAPIPSSNVPVTFAIIGDLGQFPHSIELLSDLYHRTSSSATVKDDDDDAYDSPTTIQQETVNSIILAGDIAYTSYNHRSWDTFFDFLDDTNVADTIPMQICPGNHDIDKVDNGTEFFLAYEHRFRMPRIREPQFGQIRDLHPTFDPMTQRLDMELPLYPLPYEYGNAYYSYIYGSAKFIMISSYSSMEPNSTQYNWIQSELQETDRTVTPWVVVVLHTPMYNTFALHHNDPQILAAKQHLEPLFIQYNVNIVFSGHIHAYQRTKPVVYGTPTNTGPIYITVGAGGRNCKAPFTSIIPEDWVDVRDATYYGYGMFRIFNATHSDWEWIHTGTADDHTYNQVRGEANVTLDRGPSIDRVMIHNQYFM